MVLCGYLEATMANGVRVLLLGEEEADARFILEELRAADIRVNLLRVETEQAFRDALGDFEPDIILAVYPLAAFDVTSALSLARQRKPEIPFILVAGRLGEEFAIESFQRGISDYILKDKLSKLAPAVRRALTEAQERRERKSVEVALQESEDRYRDLVEHSRDLICTHDLDGRILSINPFPAAVLGYSQDALLRMNIKDILAPKVREQFDQYLAQIKENRSAAGLMLVQTATGERRIWEYNNTLRATDVSVPFVRGMAHDVTETKRTENETKIRSRQQAAVAELGYHALSNRDLNTFLQQATQVTAETLNVELCKVLELLPESDELLLRAGVGWKEGLVGKGRVSTGTESQAGFTLLSAEPVIVEDLRTESRFHGPPLLLDHGVISGISVVIPGRESPYGVMGAHTASRRTFTHNDTIFLQAVANLVGAAVDRDNTDQQILSSGEQLRTLIANVPGAVYRCGYPPDRTIEIISNAIEEISGYPASDFIHNKIRTFISMIHPDDWKDVEQKAIDCLAKKIPYDFEYRIFHADGAIRWVRDKGAGIYSKRGDLLYMDGFVHDITQHKQAEQERKEMSRRNAALVEALGEIVYDWRPRSNELIWEGNYTAVLGYSPQEIGTTTESWTTRVHPHDLEMVLAEVERATRERHNYDLEYRFRHRDGSYRWMHDSGVLFVTPQGELQRIIGVFSDITERKHAEEALRESLQRFELIARTTNDAVWDWDLVNQKAWWNECMYRMWGYEPGKVVPSYEAWAARIHPDDKQPVLADFQRALEIGASAWSAEYRYLRPDGSTGHVFDRAFAIRSAEGKIVRMLGAILDISERKRAEETLREGAERLRLAVQASNVGLWDWDLQTNQVVYSREWKSQLGYEEHEIGNEFSEWERRVHPDDLAPTLERIQRYLDRPEGAHEAEFRMRHKDGSWRWIYARGEVLRDTGDKPVRMLGCHLDITQRTLAEEELKKSEEKYRALFEDSNDAVFISSPEGTFIDINRAGVELLGYSSKEELLEIDINRELYFSPEEREAFQLEIERQGFVRDYELVLKKKDGEKLIALETSIPVRDEKGNITAYRGFLRDVTHLKELQQQLLQSQKIEAIGRLASGVAHDFNNILMAISGYSELILAKEDPKFSSRNDILEIVKATEQGASLTRQLLAFSRKQRLSPKILDLNQSISAIENMLRRLIREDVELVTTLAEPLGRVKVDPGQMEQIIMNLAVNARDAMVEGGKLVIHTSNVDLDEQYARSHVGAVPGRYVLIAISDTGHGMDETTLSRIFEPFFTTKEPGKGTGLGLATVYGIVKQSGGYIQVYSEPGHGTTFKIYFPRVDDPAERLAERSASMSESVGRGETILLVDDNDSVRSAVAAMLEMKGYSILQASDGKAALEVSRRSSRVIDLVITDVIMPEMSGRALAQHLNEERPDLKILFMSGYTDDGMSRHGLKGLDSTFLSKPSTMIALLSKIRGLLDEGKTDE